MKLNQAPRNKGVWRINYRKCINNITPARPYVSPPHYWTCFDENKYWGTTIIVKRITVWGTGGSHTGGHEDSSLLEHNTLLTGKYDVFFLDHLNPKDGDSKLVWNTSNYLPLHTASYPTRRET